jgi:thioredoxin family protein
MGTPRRRNRYWISVPGRMTIGSGVTTSKRSRGGVIASRFRASAKNANTSEGGAGRRCERSRTWMRTYRVRISDLTSAPVPAIRPDDHVRGPLDAPLVVMYADFTCPRCAVAYEGLKHERVRVVFRHLALKAKHPRAIALAHAAEAAANQDAFWPFHDALYEDQGRIDDPHLWARVEALGLDLERFEQDRRAERAAERVRRDTREALRAGATTTPAIFR